jgi:DNA-binding transcriptional ArsR family regulator
MQDSLRNFKAEFFKTLSHPVRIKIFELLRAVPVFGKRGFAQ